MRHAESTRAYQEINLEFINDMLTKDLAVFPAAHIFPANVNGYGDCNVLTATDYLMHRQGGEIRLSELLDDEALFRFAYVPFVIAQLVWDYADTILGMAAWLRISATKRLCRAVRELHREYTYIRENFIDDAHKNSEVENGYVFEDGVRNITNQMMLNLRIDLKSEYPDLNPEYLDYLLAVNQCDITLKALLRYTERQTQRIAGKVKRHVGRILPDAIYKLSAIIPEFVGDKPLSAKVHQLREQYIATFAAQIGIIELTTTPNTQPNETQTNPLQHRSPHPDRGRGQGTACHPA